MNLSELNAHEARRDAVIDAARAVTGLVWDSRTDRDDIPNDIMKVLWAIDSALVLLDGHEHCPSFPVSPCPRCSLFRGAER